VGEFSLLPFIVNIDRYVVSHQTANQIAKPLKKGKKEKEITSSGIVELQS
jgi:hypothetical protein